MIKNCTILIVILACFITKTVWAQTTPPGVVISHWHAQDKKYIGSPSICILPNGDYVASHDEFGPNSTASTEGRTYIFKSTDKGKTWKQISRIDGQHWSNIFNIKKDLYILGMNKEHGNIVIRRSADGGESWTTPFDEVHGLLFKGMYHTAPVPILLHNGRIYRALENAKADNEKWPCRYSAVIISAPINCNLLDASNWTHTNSLSSAPYQNDTFKGWLEGNAVATKEGNVVDIMRAHTIGDEEKCAILHLDKDNKTLTFSENDFIAMPGAAKKFTIRYDKKSKLYWTLVNAVPDTYKWHGINCDMVRNFLYLASSPDLKHWTLKCELLAYPQDETTHGFQYADWQFEGNDIIFVSRTAYDEEMGTAHNQHDANYMTFHRIKDFRK